MAEAFVRCLYERTSCNHMLARTSMIYLRKQVEGGLSFKPDEKHFYFVGLSTSQEQIKLQKAVQT